MIKAVCSWCGGENVKLDAWAVFDFEAQAWVLESIFDAGYCDDCDGEANIDEIDVNDEKWMPSNLDLD
jgi:hypothetical protein